jgi:hypothetical protein
MEGSCKDKREDRKTQQLVVQVEGPLTRLLHLLVVASAQQHGVILLCW